MDEARERGFEMRIGDLDLGWSQIAMRDIALEDRRAAVRVSLAAAEIDTNLWRLFREPFEAIEEVRLRGLEMETDLLGLLARRRAAIKEEGGGRGSALVRLPPLVLLNASIKVREGRDAFGEFEIERLRIEEDEISVAGLELRYPLPLGEGALEVRGINGSAGMSDCAIRWLSIASVDLSALRSAEESRLIFERLSRTLSGTLVDDRVSSASSPGAMGDGPGDEGERAEQLGDENAPTSMSGAKGAAQMSGPPLRTPGGTEEGEGDDGRENANADESKVARDALEGAVTKGSLRDRFARLSARFGSRFRMSIGTLLLPATEGVGAFRVEDLEIEREAEDNGLSIRGRGEDEAEARAEFDLRFSLSELRADGKIDIERLRLGAIASLLPWIPFHEPESAQLDASILLTAESLEEIAYEAELDLHHVGFFSPRIAAEPIVDLEFGLSAIGGWNRLERSLRVAQAEIRLGEAKANFGGAVRFKPEALGVDLKMSLPRTPCDDAVHSLPRAILGSASGFRFRGMMSGEVELRFDWEAIEELELSVRLRQECRFIDWPRNADPSRFQRFFVHEALSPTGEPFDFETGPMTEAWAPLESLSPYLLPAFLAHEDAAFLRHGGFSLFAIRESLIRNLSRGRFERGASTISMQLAKNLFLNREKVLVRKLREVLYTWWLESAFGKEQILELYANVVELGPYIYGVKSASLHYFGREPSELSPAEAAFLATSLPAPRRAAEQYERGELSRSGRSRIANLLRSMKRRGLISEEAADYGLEELDGFRFYRRGDPLPPERTLPESPPLFEFQPGAREGREARSGERDDGPRGEGSFEHLSRDPWALP